MFEIGHFMAYKNIKILIHVSSIFTRQLAID